MDSTQTVSTSIMSLPTEVRLQILREVFTFGKSYLRCRRFYLSGVPILKKLWHGPLLANRQIRSEALTIIFGDPLWRLVTDQFAWGIQQHDISTLLRIQTTNELALIRRFRFEFDLDQRQRAYSLKDVQKLVDAASSGLIICCDMLALARASLDIEIAWIERNSHRGMSNYCFCTDSCNKNCFREAKLGMLSPFSRLSNLRSITITQYWELPKDGVPSNLQFSRHLELLTGVTPTWSLPRI